MCTAPCDGRAIKTVTLHLHCFAGVYDIIPSQVFAAALESFNAIVVSRGVPLIVPLINR